EAPDIDYEIRGPALHFFHNIFPSSITGIPGHPVENVVLENIEITYPGRGNPAYANLPVNRLTDVPENVGDYPEFSMFGELPAWGLYVRHATGITMRNWKMRIRKPDYRPAMIFDDVKKLDGQGVELKGDEKRTNPTILHETDGTIIH
ncbi:MAG: glycoside hydrolase family 28 protein, partial [Bacteroidota bacterium]